jgi:2-keto-4-pentenoate hydratase/2-oxohepta-3-ene-1,7-dioic acid hydratase in catechol pathway
MELRVDGQVRQRSSTDQMVFPVSRLIADISTIITLVPGDLIATGTPSGVGHTTHPPSYLTPGSTVTATIDGLGVQTTSCVPASSGGCAEVV